MTYCMKIFSVSVHLCIHCFILSSYSQRITEAESKLTGKFTHRNKSREETGKIGSNRNLKAHLKDIIIFKKCMDSQMST